MRASRGVRGVVASLFVMSVAAVGLGIAAPTAGAGEDGIRCIRPPDIKSDTPAQPEPDVGECAQLEVTKVVTGTPAPSPAPGTTFNVVVDCVRPEKEISPRNGAADAQQLPQGQSPPFTTTLTFPEGGGIQSVFITSESECTVSESPPPGCTLTSIDPVKTQIERAIIYPVTVTNNCDPAAQAAPAAAVVQEPRFTG